MTHYLKYEGKHGICDASTGKRNNNPKPMYNQLQLELNETKYRNTQIKWRVRGVETIIQITYITIQTCTLCSHNARPPTI